MHDMSVLEKEGIACVALVSSAFLPQARWQSGKLGLVGEAALLVGVEHPFSDQTGEEIRGKADAVFEEVVTKLTETVGEEEKVAGEEEGGGVGECTA